MLLGWVWLPDCVPPPGQVCVTTLSSRGSAFVAFPWHRVPQNQSIWPDRPSTVLYRGSVSSGWGYSWIVLSVFPTIFRFSEAWNVGGRLSRTFGLVVIAAEE